MMTRRLFRWGWLLLLIPVIIGFIRLRFNVEVLDLLPGDVPAVHGLKLYQQNFSNARELVITVSSHDRDTTEAATQAVSEQLRNEKNLVAEVTWQPPWLEHPEQTTEFIAHLWLNQPPDAFSQLADRLAETNLASVLTATREHLATTLSPRDIAQLSYDPFGFTRLPENIASAAPGFGEGQQMFSSPDGKFRILFVKSRDELTGYRECTEWFASIKEVVSGALAGRQLGATSTGYTGRPAFVTEISGSIKRDITLSVGGTAVIIAVLFWLAHRRLKPMLWLLALLGLILAGTLAFGGLLFGSIHVISMGFAAILLGLAVDYAVVHYQEALAHPDLSIPEIRRAIAPSIFWAAVTTIVAFLVLNLGGLPGLAQLGSLVGLGVMLSAFVMIFAFLPPLFPDRRQRISSPPAQSPKPSPPVEHHLEPLNATRTKRVFATTIGLVLLCVVTLLFGLPGMDTTTNALRPRDSQAYTALDAIKANLNENRDPLWVLIKGGNESEVAERLAQVEPALNRAVSNQTLTGFTLPAMLWPRPEFQSANRRTAQWFISQRETFRNAALAGGFSADAMGLADGVLNTWQHAVASTNVFWPTNSLSTWILEKLTARRPESFYAVGILFPGTNNPAFQTSAYAKLEAELPRDGVWLSGWELLGNTVLTAVKQNLWKLVLPMVGLVLLSLWFAFGRFAEILLSLTILFLSGLCLLAVMKFAGWSWNVLNLMALPLILGTGVDYSLFMQLALRRHHGDLRVAHRSVGRALLLCGGTAVAGFGTLGLSSNAGMASLGQVCAVGIASNMLISVYLLPVWWRVANTPGITHNGFIATAKPSQSYRAGVWRFGLVVVRRLPERFSAGISTIAAEIYQLLRPQRCRVVVENLLPILGGSRRAAERTTRLLFRAFAHKITDLWRYESGVDVSGRLTEWNGWESFSAAQARGKGVLILTPHLGNWEFGGAFLAKRGFKLLVLTQPEPGRGFTELRQQARARWGIETLVVGEDAFAFVEIIKRLQDGATVAMLVDRPPPSTAVKVELFGKPFMASIAAAELARASGCALLPVYVVRKTVGYSANVLPEIHYGRAAISNREARIKLTQEILRAFEPAIRQHAEQWYHFVPIWP